MPTFRCTRCKKKLKAPDEWGGKQVKCSGCGERLSVPEVLAELPEPRTIQYSADADPFGEEIFRADDPPAEQLASERSGQEESLRGPAHASEMRKPKNAAKDRWITISIGVLVLSFVGFQVNRVIGAFLLIIAIGILLFNFRWLYNRLAETKSDRPGRSPSVATLSRPIFSAKEAKSDRPDHSSVDGIFSASEGKWLITMGAILVGYFFLVYDTSVPVDYFYSGPGARVHNIGRMQNRQLGILVGFGSIGVGLTLSIVARNRREDLASNDQRQDAAGNRDHKAPTGPSDDSRHG